MTSSDKDSSSISLPYRPCVGIMLFNKEGRVFVGRRNDIERPSWQMPQGGIDPNEDPKKAAFRELEEETGIKTARIVGIMTEWLSYDYPPGMSKMAFSNRYRGQTQLWFAMLFTGSESEINLQTRHAEFDDWKWCKLECLLSIIVDFKRPVYEILVDKFRYLSTTEL